ncbi:MAG TPA: BACON domain-containing carbohydrate-binding protein [Syntrophorhabdales bacterium]|nr:BACON domain-containing carbohydrate-binding protein [Syntrophorhabdales bacterium]
MAFGHLPCGRAARLVQLALTILATIFTYSLASPDSASAAQATIAWDPDTSPGVAGYKAHWGTVSRNYSWSADAATQTTYTVPSLSQGATYYFAATAYDAAGNQSGYSNEVSYTVPSACTYAISPASQSIGAGGGTANTNVSTGTGCNWTTSNSTSWISINSGVSGTGSGTVTYSATANTGAPSRTAAFTIAGQILTITQAGAPTYTLSVSTSGTGSGTVTNNPSGTTFVTGTSVTLTATPGANSTFVGWSGPCAGTGTCTVTMNANLSVTAAFNLQKYTISASAGSGGSISPSGSVSVNAGTGQSFTITPSSGYQVAAVTADGSSVGAVTSYAFSNVTANHTISASFTALTPATYTLTIGTTGAGSGTVSSSPSGTTFNAGTPVTLTATAGPNSTFAGWSGACSGTSSSCTVAMNSNLSVQASFAQSQSRYPLTITRTGSGTGTVYNKPFGTTFSAGTYVTLYAMPGFNSTFGGWSGACSGTSSMCTVVMTGNLSVTATFNSSRRYSNTGH